jgi:hypothetical protein
MTHLRKYAQVFSLRDVQQMSHFIGGTSTKTLRTRKPFMSKLTTSMAAVCALGALAVAPSAMAADAPAKVPVPGANLAQIAAKYRTSVSQVAARAAQLAPAIKELTPGVQPLVKPRLKVTRVGKAPVDECYAGIGLDGPAPDANGNCPAGTKPKRNQDYFFGSARSGDNLFWGTFTNPMCNVGPPTGIKMPAFENDDVSCSMDSGWSARHLGYKAYGDLRRPTVNMLNADTNKLTDITPTEEQAPNLKYSYGLRGQGAHNGVVLLGGFIFNPTATAYAGVEMLAYDGDTGKFLGETVLPQYANMRHGTVIDGHLYFGMRLAGGATGTGTGGAIVKWTGDKQDPFRFEVVAQGLPSEPGYITGHDHHIITAGWTSVAGGRVTGAMPEMYQSPTIPAGGLTSATADASNWKSIFRSGDFEPDPLLARIVQFGDLTSYNGKLVFSTYTYGGFGTVNAFANYGKPTDELGRINTFLNAERATSIFEMTNVGQPDQKVRLLYGDTKLPVYNTTSRKWELQNNKLNQVAKFGPAGFGNRFNYYSWTWEKFKGSLYMSTFDGSSMANGMGPELGKDLLELSPQTIDLFRPVLNTIWNVQGGGDTWRFDTTDKPAVPENLDGFGNRNSHGVRGYGNFEDKGKLYAGMASWANLNNTAKNAGGWEVNQLQG